MSKDLVLNHRGVVENVDSFYGHAWNFGNQDSSKSVGNRGIHSHQIKLHLEVVKRLDVYFEIVPELLEIPRSINARTVAGIVGAGDLKNREMQDPI